ncbi:MAG: glycosyltransferase family 2 protein [Planctomycetota bacterium]
MLVSICIASYRRPEGLRRLLTAIEQQRFTMEEPQVEVCVADNDPDRAGSAVCAELRENFRWPLRCEIEPIRGLSSARNRSVSLAANDSDFLAFIDDDEEPTESWLDQLLITQKHTDADVVGGPVLARFAVDPPQWATAGAYFSSERMATGTELPFAATGNVLVNTAALRNLPGPFDLRFSHSGGEDTHLFIRLRQRGHRIVWCDEAVVHEHVAAERINMRWVLRRGARSFGTYSLCRRELGGWRTLPMSLAKGTVRMAIGVLLLPLALFRGKELLVRGLLQISQGSGRILGWFGRLPAEYSEAKVATR